MSPLFLDGLMYAGVVVGVLFLLVCLIWLVSRLDAETCPRCGSRWWTEEEGEWAGEEDWACRSCGNHWSVPYGR